MSTYKNYISDPSLGIPKVTAWRHSRSNHPYNDGRRSNRSSESDKNVQTKSAANDFADGCVQAYKTLVETLHESNSHLNDPALQEGTELRTGESCEEDFDANDDTENESQPCPSIDSVTPIYKDAPISVGVSLLLIVTYAMAYHLTGEGTADLLVLIELHCISPNLCSKTMKMFTDYFRSLRAPLEYHHYCYECHHYFGLSKVSPCPGCRRHSHQKDPPSYFIMLPIVDQIKSLFGGTSLMKEIFEYKNQFLNRKDNDICDILDGELYKERFSNGFFRGEKDHSTSEELHISIQMNTDGVSLFHSSTFSIWPVYFIINELPPHLRFSRNNRIFGGLWFGYSKPDFKVFLRPFAEMLRDFYFKGVMVDDIKVRGLLFNCVFDAPARCLFHNMVQFNGFYGCPYCMSPGESVKTSERGHTHAYPYVHDSQTGHHEKRTHEVFIEQGTSSEHMKSEGKVGSTVGVKGLTWFSFLPKFDMVRGVGIDYMHCVCLGVMKMLMTLWFDKSYKNESFSITNKLSVVNERLLNIRPPRYITRLPRSLLDIGHYKAAEYKTFMLYYSLPCLYGVLPSELFEHYLLLVQAIFILLSDHITSVGLVQAKRMLMHFCINLSAFYSPRYMTSNVHLLLHLVDKVRDLGPLWATSCFYFEDFNGQLRSLFHGTQKIESQIVFAVSVHQNLHRLASCIKFGSYEEDFFQKITGKKTFSEREKITENVFIISAITPGSVTEIERHAIMHQVGPFYKLCIFKRAFVNGSIVHSRNYKCVVKRNNTVVQFGSEYGHVLHFAKVYKKCPNSEICTSLCICQIPLYLAIVDSVTKLCINLCSESVSQASVSNIVPVSHPTGVLKAIHVEDISAVCIWMPVSQDLCFISKHVNKIEKE
ncbi:uncharacterized protein [Argopecten irradians]|uniref:uncharacterized protein n=1 Tax=Argopecten irradians TaxID=31199 RepID=UPI003713F218